MLHDGQRSAGNSGTQAESLSETWSASRIDCPPYFSFSFGEDLLCFLPNLQNGWSPMDPLCLLANFPLSQIPLLFSSTQKRNMLWFLEESRSEFFQIWQQLLARFLLGCLVWFHEQLGNTCSRRTTSLSWELGKSHVNPPVLMDHHGFSAAKVSRALDSSVTQTTCLGPLWMWCSRTSAASLHNFSGTPNLPSLVHIDSISVSPMLAQCGNS